jgi:hypothetical protein
MTAACAAIWLADIAAVFDDGCGATCARFEVAVDGNVESNNPCVAAYFFDSFLTKVDGDPSVATRGEPAALGREKLCRLGELLFG